MATLTFELDTPLIEQSNLVHQPSRQKTARAILGKDVERWRGSIPRMTQKLLAEKVQRLLHNAPAPIKLTARVISELELGSQNATRLTVRQLRVIAQVLGGVFIVRRDGVEQPVSDGDTQLETLFREGARLSIEDPAMD